MSRSVRSAWQRALHLDWDALDLAAGMRVGICLAVPVVIGLATGRSLDGLVVGLGSLNVAMADVTGSYSVRAATLLSVLIGNSLGIAAGTLTALAGWWSVPLLMAWVFLAAYAGVIGPVAERTGFFAALMFIIGIGFGEPSLAHAARYAGLVAVGGMWAVLVITLFWPLHPHRPVVRAWGRSIVASADLLELVAQCAPDRVVDRAVTRARSLGHEASAVTRWHAVRAGRPPPLPGSLRLLAKVGDRAWTCAVLVADERRRHEEPPDAVAERLVLTADIGQGLAAIGRDLDRDGNPGPTSAAKSRRVCASVESRLASGNQEDPALQVLCRSLAVLSGKSDEALPLSAGDRSRPHIASALTKLHASLRLSSFWLRYALRFSVAVGAGLAVSRGLGLEKGYWVLITIAVVVKPQLSLSTTSTIHRVIGTVLGALVGLLAVVTVSSSWGLVIVMSMMTVLGISFLQVNYGLAVVFITPLIIVLLNVVAPGHWQLADIRVADTLLGAAIGLIATVAILPGSERGLVAERSRTAVAACARYLQAIGHQNTPERLAARRSARAATDDLLAVVDRAMAEPTTVGGAHVDAGSRTAVAVEELWAQETWLALSVPAEQMTPALRGQLDAATACVERMTRVLGGSDPLGRSRADRSAGDAASPMRTELVPGILPVPLIDAIHSVEGACVELAGSAPLEQGRSVTRRASFE